MSQTIIPPQYDPAKGLTLFETQQAIDKIKVNFILNLALNEGVHSASSETGLDRVWRNRTPVSIQQL